MPLFGNRLKYVSCKIWDATKDGFTFPEQGDPAFRMMDLGDRPNVGLAFSGGGTRSAAATLGQLRGLNELNLLDNVRFISCVSGGSWACTPYTYLPEDWTTDETFLGQVVSPKDVTLEHLQNIDRNSFAHAISNAVIIDNLVSNAVRFAGDETFSRAVGDIFLKPFDIDSLKRFFSFDEKSVAAIVLRNRSSCPSTEINEDDFYVVRPGRPYLIVGCTLLRPNLPWKIHFEVTPIYTGARVLHREAGSNKRNIGGGYIESFGMDSIEPDDRADDDGIVRVRLGASRHRFTLSDAIGTSSAAAQKPLVQLGVDWVGMPEFNYWSPIDANERSSREYEFGDGGILENLGIMPLLMRKVEKIVVFVNSKTRLKGGGKGQIAESIRTVFGQTPDFLTNRVFPGDRYQALVQGLVEEKTAGHPVMFKDQYRVVGNQHYGIDDGWDVEVLWVYNERVRDWETSLPVEIRRLIGSGSLGNFPHYRTFFQNPPAVIDLSSEQVSMLAHLSCWNIVSNEAVFHGMLT